VQAGHRSCNRRRQRFARTRRLGQLHKFRRAARYNLGQSVPFTAYKWGTGQNCAPMTQSVVAEAGRGTDRPSWELVYNHYAVRRGLSAPNSAAYAKRVRAEGGGGDYGPNSGGYDQLGFGTLTFTR
jgi:hypothetical protein